MDTVIPELDNISRKLMGLERPPKLKLLVVDDEPDNLDLLYRTFRRDFTVLRAESGVAALKILAEEGEVAVIISDQRMPEMKGTEFLSKTVPQFPNTMRIILTGFTDVEDLVEAINSGQVYKYITKPWDPTELRVVVQRAAETYELVQYRTAELRRAQAQTLLLSTIVQVTREATSVGDGLTSIAHAFGLTFSADRCILQLVQGDALTPPQGIYSKMDGLQNWLGQDPLVKQAIATQAMQVVVNVLADSSLAHLQHYLDTQIQAHFVIPIVFQGHVLAVLSLQWAQPSVLQEDELTLLHLCAQQVALVLTCTRYQTVA